MGRHRLARCFLGLLFVPAAVSGCQALNRSRPAPVLVRDAETHKPIAEAEVRITYPLADSPLAPGTAAGKTGSDGFARLRATPYGDTGIVVQASARGYFAEEQYVAHEKVEAIEPASLFERVERRPARFVLDLYTESTRPLIELVLPAGYRGVVKAHVQVEEGGPVTAGQRTFRFAVPASGEVQVVGPSLLHHLRSSDFTARQGDGPPLHQDAKESEIGFWCLKADGASYSFLVGTQADLEAHRPEALGAPAERQSSSGGKRGGRGGRGGGRRGGGQATSGTD